MYSRWGHHVQSSAFAQAAAAVAHSLLKLVVSEDL